MEDHVHKAASPSAPTRVVVATTVMLSFISFWRAAAIVLNDLGSSAYYVGGIAEQAVGPAAPWFVLGVMLFSYAVRSVYIESCAMFTRGGVYRVVKEAMGGTLAKLSVSALIFDYVLTGPISGVSAGQYIVGLVAQTLTYFGHPWAPSSETINLWAAAIAVLVTVYFWRRNTRGLHESSDDALRIMYVTTAMVVTLILWSGLTILTQPDKRRLPPPPVPQSLSFDHDAVGWLPSLAKGALTAETATVAESSAPTAAKPRYRLAGGAGSLLGLLGILIAFGHSLLAMSGEESLAQVNRELEYPKHKNLVRAGMVIFVYSLLFTSLVSFFAYSIIPEEVRSQYKDNLISGISMFLVGPLWLRLAFQAFIVVVGFLMLAGAINTSIIGANGVLNRVSEDGVMPTWVRAPHGKYGTSYRLINLIVLLQIVAIVGSRGETYTLGEAYAFGVVWSFAFKALAVAVLRFKDRRPREWKVPFNLRLGGHELPLGLGAITTVLFVLASVNLVTKQVATISGIGFTLVFFVLFLASERMNEKRRGSEPYVESDEFRLDTQETILAETVGVRPGSALCLVRDYNTLDHLKWALEATHTGKKDLVVLTVRVTRGADVGYEGLAERSVFASYEQLLFSRVVALAEKAGKKVHLLVVPSSKVFDAAVQTAIQIESSEIISGLSSVMIPIDQARGMGEAWERMPHKPRRPLPYRVVQPGGGVQDFNLGAHAPKLTAAEVELVHELWLDLSQREGLRDLHHHEVVAAALARFVRDLRQGKQAEVLRELRRVVQGQRPVEVLADPGGAALPSPPPMVSHLSERPPSQP
jgi:amino acid transporter